MADYSKSFRDAKESAENAIITAGDGVGNEERPDYKSPIFRDLWERMDYVRACHGGTETMREKGQDFLPKMAREEDDDYRRRRMRTIAYNAVKRTGSGLAGMIFRKDLILDGPEITLDDMEDVDLLGNDINVFARRLVEDTLRDGYGWIHVEAPAQPASNRAEEVALNIRPYWRHIDAGDAINWQYEMIAGQPMLTLFVCREWRIEPKGTYGQMAVECYRVLRPGTYEVWEKQNADGKVRFELVEEGQTGIPYVPVVFVPGLERAPEDSRPALQGIADLQIAWFQRWSLLNTALDYAVPMPVIRGVQADGIEFGAGRALFIPDAEGGAEYLEAQGASWEACRQQLKDIELGMAIHGLAMLSRETRAAETAESKRIDKSESDSQLAVIAKGLESALNQALWFHALYRGNEAASARVNRDFMDQQLDPGTIQVLVNMVQQGIISLDTLWDTLKAGEILPDSFDKELERERVGEVEIMAALPPMQEEEEA